MGGNVTVTPPSGSLFPLGTTTVTATATDFSGNTTTRTFEVEVVDTKAPVIDVPDSITAEATGPDGAVVAFTATAQDVVSGSVPVTYDFPPGSTFPLGFTAVTAFASDAAENMATAGFAVNVVDTTPPVLSLPPTVIAEATSPSGAVVSFTATAQDLVSGAVPVALTPPSDSLFAIGTTTVAASAVDAAGNATAGELAVIVRDSTPPSVTGLTATPNELWPPNHKMVTVQVDYQTSDNGGPVTTALKVRSNQPPGLFRPDFVVVDAHTVRLRAERSFLGALFGKSRVYTITVEATDAFGNVSIHEVDVTVPAWKHHHRGFFCRHKDHDHDGDDD
jgi:hypothetical protein